ncbi:TetR/AcrR family transcriptional regulator [Dactylosporangium sp. NPDC051541]|uniref:TetR/AcrR family transcriptional regulator n=1 Tax=Dactylosporangium sp. NPDC051541 TaxID=3363977 RepID=UPI00379C0982
MPTSADVVPTPGDAARRDAVLESALRTFARFGYRKTSMDDVAREAAISRPGLYFLFSSKPNLFRAAADHGIERDLRDARQALLAPGRPLGERIAAAFDCWAGRYVGPLQDVNAVVRENPDLLGPVARGGPDRFERLLIAALREAGDREPEAVAQTLVSASIGIKHQTASRDEYRARMAIAVELLTRR